MALVVKDRVKQDTTTTGTGTLTLSGSYSGFDTFSEIGNTNTTYYVISDPGSGDWEVGLGTYTASGTLLSRDTILASSNSGSVVTLAAGTKVVFCGYPAGKSVYLDASGNLLGIAGTVSATNLTGATVTATSNIHTPALSATNIIAATITATSNIHTPTLSATNITAATVTVTTKIHTAALSATNITTGTVTATSIHTLSLSVTNLIAATITATSNIHTPALSATAITAGTVSATNIYAVTKIHTPSISATNILATTVSATNIHAATDIHTPAISATNIVTTSITTSVVFAITGQYGDELDSGFTPVYLLTDSPFTFTINSMTRRLSAGTIIVSAVVLTSAGVQTTVTGLNGITADTTKRTDIASANNIVAVTDALLLNLTGVAATDRNFSFTLKCTRSNFSGA